MGGGHFPGIAATGHPSTPWFSLAKDVVGRSIEISGAEIFGSTGWTLEAFIRIPTGFAENSFKGRGTEKIRENHGKFPGDSKHWEFDGKLG